MSQAQTYQDIKINTQDKVYQITLTRSEVKNALRTHTLQEITLALQEASTAQMHCIIITGGEEVFAAGADINELEAKDSIASIKDVRTSYWEYIKNYKIPIIAVVNGYCLGGGCELAMHCDIIIAGDNAQFGQPEVNLGIMPGAGGTQRLTKAVGKSNAMFMLLTGHFIDATTAQSMGLVTHTCPASESLPYAHKIASPIASKSTLATSLIKQSVLKNQDVGLSDGLAYEKMVFSVLLDSADKKEGILAFKEKRKPVFLGK